MADEVLERIGNIHLPEDEEDEIHIDDAVCKQVLNGGPWNFGNHLLALQRWVPGMKADQVQFHDMAFWVQIWGLPFEFVNRTIGEITGRKIGHFLAVDNRMVGGEKGKFIRVRVELPLDKPIKRGGFITLGSGTKYWVDYKYERLCRFCHYCGSINHEQSECDVKKADEKDGTVKEGKFGSWLKAGGGGGARALPDHRGDSSRQTAFPVTGQTSKGKFNLDEGKESARIMGKESNSRLIDMDDNDRISLNGKELRVGELIGSRAITPSSVRHKEIRLVDRGPTSSPESGKMLGPGDSLNSQDPPTGGLHSIEPSQVGQQGISNILLIKESGSSPVIRDSNLKEGNIMEHFGKENAGASLPFIFVASNPITSSPAIEKQKNSGAGKKLMVQYNNRSKKVGKESSGVLGKRRSVPIDDQAANALPQHGDLRGGEKRLVLCETNSPNVRVGVASLNWPPTSQ
ncbi:hypothetical protein Vadar_005988 [Vaccinium darrowii]|uniref:Uncharacterized protein n=1 Tax=Vaccinium darrowii TaxID=229202 RepID=A0ACB7WYR3_9ERIC|nr:hypothetical protein Vadar_005988 [Vaccinium darrowii]